VSNGPAFAIPADQDEVTFRLRGHGVHAANIASRRLYLPYWSGSGFWTGPGAILLLAEKSAGDPIPARHQSWKRS